ncbi:DMT family transporter [uncultured Roseobacter sp.]|uniref:DMT family transporter n=1 Tax=uncultured Roseobacter sp. TaxID=114847 RepID=UPI002618EB1D|nr:DMT family transporter [uncultured Roseobacter sp.]
MTLKQHTGPLLGLLTVLCWAGYNVAAKHGVDTGLSPNALAFLRFAVPGLIVLPLLSALHLRGKAAGIPVRRLLSLVALGGPVFGLFAVSGYLHAPLSHGLLFAPVAVFVSGSLLGRLLLQERVSSRKLKGAALMFAGLATLVGLDISGLGASWAMGAAFFVLAGTMWGGYTVLLRLWQIPMIEGTLSVAGASSIIAVPVLGVTASETLLMMAPADLIFQIIMQGLVGGVFSVAALIGAVRLLPAHVAALLPVFTPVVALGIAASVSGTLPGTAEISGALIIIAGFVTSLGISPGKLWPTTPTATPHS